jgi:hypothetical protein
VVRTPDRGVVRTPDRGETDTVKTDIVKYRIYQSFYSTPMSYNF